MKFIQRDLTKGRLEITVYQNTWERVELGIVVDQSMVPLLISITLFLWSIEIGYYTKKQWKIQKEVDEEYRKKSISTLRVEK